MIDRRLFAGLLSLGAVTLHVEHSDAQSPPPINLIPGPGCTFTPGPNYHGGTGTINCSGTGTALVTAVEADQFVVTAGTLMLVNGPIVKATPGSGPLLINAGAVATVPTPANGTALQIVSATTPAARIELDGIGFPAGVVQRRANGTPGTLTAITSGQFLGFLDFSGYTGAAYAAPNRVEIGGFATENWDATHQGSGIAFNVVTQGTTTPANGMSFVSTSGTLGQALFGSLGASGVPDGTAAIQTHETLLAGAVELGVSTGPQIIQGSGAPPGGTVAVSTLYLRNNGAAGTGLYYASAGGSYVAIDNPVSQWSAGTVTTVSPSGSLAAGTLTIPAPAVVTAAGLGAVINAGSVQINNAITLAGTAGGTLAIAPGSGTSDVQINMPAAGGTVSLGCTPAFVHQRWIESITQGATAGVLNLGTLYVFGSSPTSFTITATANAIDRLAIESFDGTHCAVLAVNQNFAF